MKRASDIRSRLLNALLLLPLLLHLLPATAAGQERSPQPGDRIRVQLSAQPEKVDGAAAQTLSGRFVGWSADTLLLRVHPTAGVTAVARVGIEHLDVSRGVRTRLESAALNGARFALFGTVERVVFASIVRDRCDEALWESALIGAAGGAFIGIVAGALKPQERWERLRGGW